MNILILFVMSIVIQSTLTVKSPAFGNKDFIPSEYTCDGSNINPPLIISDIPGNTKSLVLIVEDPDASKGTFDHWIMWNIPSREKIEENSVPGIPGKNGRGENKYTGPCPPEGTHHYHFKVYSLDAVLDLPQGSNKESLEDAMDGHVISSGELIGLYKR